MPKSGTNVSIPTKLLATAVALAVTLVVCGTAATVMVSTDIARKGEKTALEPNAVLLEREFFRDRGATADLLDSLVAPLGNLKPASDFDVALITAAFARRRLDNATIATTASQNVWVAAADSLLPARVPEAPSRLLPLSFGIDSLTKTELDAAIADTSSAWLPVYRRWARSAPLPALWGYRSGTMGMASLYELPPRDFSAMRALFAMNEHAALLELQSGHAADAMNRARENLSASRHLLEQPLLFDALVGRMFARRAVGLLALAARRVGDSATVRNAMHLDSLASRSGGQSVLRWVVQEEVSPASTAAEHVTANRALHPGLRVAAMNSIVMGGCRNVREVLFGFSGARRGALLRSENSLTDVSRGTELAALFLNKFDAIVRDHEGSVSLVEPARASRLSALGPMQWIVPPGVRARVLWCSTWGY